MAIPEQGMPQTGARTFSKPGFSFSPLIQHNSFVLLALSRVHALLTGAARLSPRNFHALSAYY
jgi:hypothetical protein